MASVRFIKAKSADTILTIDGIDINDHIAGYEDKNSIEIRVSSALYTYDQVKSYFTNNDISIIESYISLIAAPATYEDKTTAVLCDTYSGYVKEIDINYDQYQNMFTVILQKETQAYISALQCKSQSIEAQASLVELVELLA